MSWALLVGGLLVVVLAMFEALRTTLAVGNVAGPVTGWVNHGLWTLALRTRSRRVLQAAGVPLTLNALVIWLALLWVGWTLLFSADAGAVVSAGSGVAAGFWERAYFTGNTLFTLGSGELLPNGVGWQLMTVVATINGLFVITLGITYLVPVAQAATERRRMAAVIDSLGARPDDVVIDAWDEGRYGALRHYLMTMAPDVALLAQRHLAYPVLHYFHSGHVHTAAAPMIARLDEIVTLLRCALREPDRPDPYVTRPLHEALTQFLDTLGSAFVDAAPVGPPLPPLDRIRAAGLPTVSDEEFATALQRHDQRRRLLLALVHNDGWAWGDVWPAAAADEHEPTGRGEQ